MTLDKFGRHIVKQARLSMNNDDDDKHVINVSEYMYYNLILKFESDKLIRKTFVLNSGMNHYSFPLEWGLIEKVLVHLYAQDDISVTINDKILTRDELVNYPLKMHDKIGFISNVDKIVKKLAVEIIIKCPIKFERDSVTRERAYYTNPSSNIKHETEKV